MNYKIYNHGIILLLMSFAIQSCNEFNRTEVEKEIYVNKSSISAFVGDQIQLIASPTDGTYQFDWASEDLEVATVDDKGSVNVVGEGNTYIVVNANGIVKKIPLSAIIRIPPTDVILSETSVELMPYDKISFSTTVVPNDANDVPPHKWYSENPEIVAVNELGDITLVGEGTTNIVYQLGEIVKKVKVDAAFTKPFRGPHILSASGPCEIPAANFDLGGEGFAFHDADPENKSGGDSYRQSYGDTHSLPVEIEGNGNNIGYTAAGEWLLYTVEVHDPGDYLVDISISANGTSGKFHIEVDNVDLTGSISIPDNGSWSAWRWFPEPAFTINFTEGKHKVKYFIEGASHNFRAIRFTKK